MSEKGKGVGFERIRRITGYLVGTLDRFNNAKRAEVEDRVKHSTDKAEHREFLSKAEQRRYEQMKKMKGE